MSAHTKQGRKASFREHCTGASRHRKRVARVMRDNLRRQFGGGSFVVGHTVDNVVSVAMLPDAAPCFVVLKGRP